MSNKNVMKFYNKYSYVLEGQNEKFNMRLGKVLLKVLRHVGNTKRKSIQEIRTSSN